MGRIADAYNNPFLVEDNSTPPARSAFAVLNADREELERSTIDEVLARAIEVLREEPDLATVYGQPVEEADLELAAEALSDPKSRVVSELLDFKHHRFDLAGLDELGATISEYKSRLTKVPRPKVCDLSLIAHLLIDLVGTPETPRSTSPHLEAPELPPLADLLDGLA